jgi:hypothetical protein
LPAATSWATPTGQALAYLDSRASESDALEAEVLTDMVATVADCSIDSFSNEPT